MISRLVPVLGVLLLVGCAALDRESYSLIIRKPAHRYEEPTAAEREQRAALKKSMEESGRRMEDSIEFSPLKPFRPFAYCTLHDSSHSLESVIALAAAPAEYPLAVTNSVVASFVLATLDEVSRLLGLKKTPVRPEERPEEPPR